MSVPGKGNHNSGFRFGSFEIDVAAGELRKHGLRIRLADQPFAVLSVLVERAGQIVTREELQQRLWPGDNLVDSEHGLNKAINKIRDALGDSPAYPRFIETLPKRGYKFIGHLEPIEARSTSSRPPETPVRPARSQRMAWTVAALVLMAISLAALGFRTHPPQSAVIQA